jgi:hypothetical protein
MTGEINFPGLEEKLAEIVQRELAKQQNGPAGYYSTKGAARYLDMTTDALNGLVKRGELVPVKRSPRRFTKEALDAWVFGTE